MSSMTNAQGAGGSDHGFENSSTGIGNDRGLQKNRGGKSLAKGSKGDLNNQK